MWFFMNCFFVKSLLIKYLCHSFEIHKSTALNATANSFSIKAITTDFLEITKARLAVSVVFSSLAGFMLGVVDFHASGWLILLKLAVGG